MWKCKEGCPVDQSDICCQECLKKDDCESACPDRPEDCGEGDWLTDELAVTQFQQEQTAVMHKVAALTEQKKALELQEKEMKEQLKAAMEKYGIKSFKTDFISIVYVEETTAVTLDSKAVQKKYPAVYDDCTKESARSAYVKITVK